MLLRWLLALGVLPVPDLAAGASEPVGIAFAQSASATVWCRDASPDKAITCAMDKCRREAAGEACNPTRWCAPAGWSGAMVAWLPEFHATMIVCGASAEAAVLAALKALCDAGEELTRCDMVGVIDPEGVESARADLTWPGPATRGTDN